MNRKRRISIKTKKVKELLKDERKNLKKDFYELLRRATKSNENKRGVTAVEGLPIARRKQR